MTQGATTIWERWDGLKPDGSFQDAGMNSFNHYAYGAIGEWMYRVVAGLEVDPAEPGYKHVLVQPQPGGGLTSAEARLETLYGEAASGWTVADGKATVSATVPPNTHGTVRLPAATLAGVSESGGPVSAAPGVKRAAQEGDAVVVEVGSGSYRFAYDGAALAARINPPARFSTRTTIGDLLANPQARAVVEKRLPGFSTDPRIPQALADEPPRGRSLRADDPYGGAAEEPRRGPAGDPGLMHRGRRGVEPPGWKARRDCPGSYNQLDKVILQL